MAEKSKSLGRELKSWSNVKSGTHFQNGLIQVSNESCLVLHFPITVVNTFSIWSENKGSRNRLKIFVWPERLKLQGRLFVSSFVLALDVEAFRAHRGLDNHDLLCEGEKEDIDPCSHDLGLESFASLTYAGSVSLVIWNVIGGSLDLDHVNRLGGSWNVFKMSWIFEYLWMVYLKLWQPLHRTKVSTTSNEHYKTKSNSMSDF